MFALIPAPDTTAPQQFAINTCAITPPPNTASSFGLQAATNTTSDDLIPLLVRSASFKYASVYNKACAYAPGTLPQYHLTMRPITALS